MTPETPFTERDPAALRSLIRFREAAYFCLAQPAHKVRDRVQRLRAIDADIKRLERLLARLERA